MSTSDGSVIGTTLIYGSTPAASAFNIVLLGDGFQSTEQTTFNNACGTFVNNALLTTAPFDTLAASHVNVYRVNVDSTDSGCDNPATGATARTYFDCTFDAVLTRLITCNNSTALTVAAAEVPEYTAVIVLANTATYGGSGGSVAVSSITPSAYNIPIHEMGHSAFGFADEYAFYASLTETGHNLYSGAEPIQPNVTKNTNRSTLKWTSLVAGATALPTMSNPDCTTVDQRANQVSASTVGLFEGAFYYHCGVYRSQYDCMMRTLGTPFCAVCNSVITSRLTAGTPAASTILDITVSNLILSAGAAQNVPTDTVVGIATATMSSGSFIGSFTVADDPTDLGNFYFNAGALSVRRPLFPGSYPINITATQSGVGGSSLTRSVTVLVYRVALLTRAIAPLNQAFTQQGQLGGYSSPPTLQYQDNNGAWIAFPGGSNISIFDFDFLHPAVPTATPSFQLAVRDASRTTVTDSITFSVAAGTMTINTIGAQTTGSTFTVIGSLSGFSSAPALQYSDDGGAVSPFPAPPDSTIFSNSFFFTHPGLSAGTHTVTVSTTDGFVSRTSNIFSVTGPQPGITITTIAPTQASVAFPVSGGFTNLSVAPSLKYHDDSLAFVPVPAGATITSSSFGFTHPGITTAGPHTVTVSTTDNALTATSNSFTVSPATITINQIPPQQVDVGFQVQGSFTNLVVPPTLKYHDDVAAFVTVPVDAVITAGAFLFNHPGISAAGTHSVTVATTDDSLVRTSNSFTVAAATSGGPVDQGSSGLMEYGWAGSGSYLTAPIVVMSTEMVGLAPSTGDVLAVGPPFNNSQGAVWADVEFIAGAAVSPATDAFVEVWILRSLDGGLTFEDGSPTVAPARAPDVTIPISQGSNIIPHAGMPGVMLPPGMFRIALRNQMGAAVPVGSSLRIAVYAEAAIDPDATTVMTGDANGTQAYRIADMMERFGVVTYSQSSITVNPWGAGTSDYTVSSVIQALTWLTANSGMTLNIREYHAAGADTDLGSGQLTWCPAVASALGAKFSVSLQRGATTTDAATLVSMAASSASGTGWMSWAEGLNTPNDGSVLPNNCIAVQQAVYAGCAATQSLAHPVAAVSPSFTYATVPPEGAVAITGYLTPTQKTSLLAASTLASVRYFPALNPAYDDSAARGGNADDVAVGFANYYGKPLIIGEWHPTSGNTDSPSHASDDSFGAFYAALMMLHAHRLGYVAWFWKSLFDIGRLGDSPYSRVGLFPNAGSDTPRLPARAIRAMYALTGDTGAKKRTFKTSRLDYSISDLPTPASNATPWTGGHHRLFQNSGGTFFLFVWNEQRPILGVATTATISFTRAMARVSHYDLTTDATVAELPVATLTNITTFTFSLTASVHLFVISPLGSTGPTESAQDASLTTTAGAIYDANGVAYTLVSNPPFGLQVNHAGLTDLQNVVLLFYHDHTVWAQNSSGVFQFWSVTSWVVGNDPRIVATESSDGLTISGPGTTIYASQTPGSAAGATLDQWTMTSGGQMAKGGVTDGTTSNVIQAYYHLHTVFHQATTGNAFGTPGWWSWSGSVWVACASPLGPTESAEGTLVSTVGPIIYASQTPGQSSVGLDTFAINGSAQVVRNGVADTSTSALIELYYHAHTVYQEATNPSIFGAPGWWSWSGTAWIDTPSPLAPVESTDGTDITTPGTIIYASQTPGQAPGPTLDQWTFTSGGIVTKNSQQAGFSSGVNRMYYAGHFVYQSTPGANELGVTPGWWRWDGTTWVATQPPQPAQKSITISTIPQQTVGVGFTVTGTLNAYPTAPTLQYRDNAGAYVALPGGALVTATSFSFAHPSIGSASGAFSIGVRDASLTTISNTSNSFAVVTAGSVTLTGITLSGQSFIAGSIQGTPIGNIAVQATGGTFSGTLALSDTAHFQIGASNTLQVGQTVTSPQTYPESITATMTGATGSPKTQAFSIIAASSGNANVSLSSPTGQVMSRYIWGFSTGALADTSVGNTGPQSTHFDVATRATEQNTLAQLRPTLLRVNADQGLSERYSNEGVTTIMNNWWNNDTKFMDPAYRFVVGVGWPWPGGSPQQAASWAATFALGQKNLGHEILYWEVANEPFGGQDVNTYSAYFNAIADALHSINPAYKVGGPNTSYFGEYNDAQWINNGANGANQVFNGAKRLGFYVAHSYNVDQSEQTLADKYAKAGGIDTTVRDLLDANGMAGCPIYLNEYNMDGTPGRETLQGTYVGAIYIALELHNAFAILGSRFEGAGLWDVCYNQNYGAVGNRDVSPGGNGSTIDPQGYYLGKAGQTLFGAAYQSSTTIANMKIVALKPTSTTFAIQLINYDTSANRTVNLSLVGGTPSSTISRWELGKSSPNAPTISTQPGLGSISVPSESIVILTGQVS